MSSLVLPGSASVGLPASAVTGDVTVAVDCMGGDLGPKVTLAASRNFLDNHPEARLILVGLPDVLAGFTHPRASKVAASEVVGMDDAVEVALRRKRDSSMRVAVQ